MRFNSGSPIFSQIAEYLEGEILAGRIKPDDRLPSARELGASLEVNPNTAARALQELADAGLARTERGLGYFVAPNGPEKAREDGRRRFFGEELPRLFRTMEELEVTPEEVMGRWSARGRNGGKE